MTEWKKTPENGFAQDPEEVQTLMRVAQAKIASGEATGAFILLCDGDGFVYMGDELPRSRSCVAESILSLEAKIADLRESWEEHTILDCDRPPILMPVEKEEEPEE